MSPGQPFPYKEQSQLEGITEAKYLLMSESTHVDRGGKRQRGPTAAQGWTNEDPCLTLSQRASLRNGMTLRLSHSFSNDRMTLEEEYRSNWHSHSLASGHLVVEVPTERVITSR